jgi:tRNA1Val (adenine37-N6)-methyltransferase
VTSTTTSRGVPSPAPDGPAEPLTEPTALFGGRLVLLQPARGYRVNVDTLLLAGFAARSRARGFAHVVDLGAGVGALGLSLALLTRVSRLTLVEANPSLIPLAAHNLARAGVPGAVLHARLGHEARTLEPLSGACDGVLCNPPFFPEACVRTPRDELQRGSRVGDVSVFLSAAARCLGRRGSAFFVYPASALPELLAATGPARLVPKRLRFVHAFPHSPARVALAELKRARPGGLVIEPPWFEWSAPGTRTQETQALIEGAAVDRTRWRPRHER